MEKNGKNAADVNSSEPMMAVSVAVLVRSLHTQISITGAEEATRAPKQRQTSETMKKFYFTHIHSAPSCWEAHNHSQVCWFSSIFFTSDTFWADRPPEQVKLTLQQPIAGPDRSPLPSAEKQVAEEFLPLTTANLKC